MSQAIGPNNHKPYSAAAICSVVFGGVGLLSLITCVGGLFGIPALICGHVALSKLKRDSQIQGKGLAIAGVAMGYSVVVLMILYFVFIVKLGGDEEKREAERVAQLEEIAPEDAECLVILPKGHRPEDPVPVAMWLHGYGWNPSELSLFEEDYQARADELGIAFVGISATAARDEGGYEWAENTDKDYRYIKSVLEQNKDRITPEWPRVTLFGFSQGAKVAGDVAGNYPGEFAGAVLMSPGGKRSSPDLPEAITEEHKYQKVFCFVGAEEAFGNVSLTKEYANEFKRLGATVVHKEYEGIDDHTTPPDYEENLTNWLSTILSAEAE